MDKKNTDDFTLAEVLDYHKNETTYTVIIDNGKCRFEYRVEDRKIKSVSVGGSEIPKV